MRQKRQVLNEAASGLRAAMAARYEADAAAAEEHHNRYHPDSNGWPQMHLIWRDEAAKWRSDQPVETYVWMLPKEFQPAGLDRSDRVLVDAKGQMSVTFRVREDR